MSFWLTEEKTISQENIKGSSSESPPPSLSSKPEDSFILEPDIILANDKVYFPDEEIAANFLSILAVHIIKSIKSEECQRKVYKPVLRVIYQELNKEKEGECESLIISSLPSVESGKCFSKNKRKKRVSRVYRTFSKSSTHTLNSKPSRQTINSIPNLETNFEEDNDAPCEEEELKACPEEAYPSNSYLYSFYLEQKLHNWTFKERDQEVEILFQNGNRYIGRISRMQMEGEGKFIWQDGTIYKGMFKSGCAHGKGEIFYPDCSWYDGEIAYNKRHGNGIMRKFSSSGDCYYYGQWFKGKKHGKGTAIYNKNVWYEGKWKYGKRDGFGIMHYASGAVYCGEWSKGNKSGYGTMIWNNNDVYCGEWSFGSMHGLGRYTWRAFKNLQFVSPQIDTFTGNFVEGKRQGFGHLCLASGASIYTSWYNRDKCGSGEVICCNGNKLKDRNLFYQDRAVQVDLFNSINLPEDMSDDIELLNLMSDEELARRVKPRSLNVNAPLHEMDFSMHINELFKIDYNLSIPQSEGDPVCVIDYNERTEVIKLEKMWLKRVIMKRMTDLRSVYNFYAAIGVDNKPTKFSIFMLRIMLHQLLRDCGITKTKYSCVDLDQMVGIGNDPFENVLMYEMIHYLITLCILTRMSPRQKNEGIPGVLAGTFDRFIDEVVIKSKDNYNGNFLKFLRFIPLTSLHSLYKTLPEPLRIKDLCAAIFDPCYELKDNMPFTSEYIQHILQGSNTVYCDGTFGYIPYEEPYVDFKKESAQNDQTPFAELSTFQDLGVENVMMSIAEAVPHTLNHYTKQIDGTFPLSFLDFCDILSNLASKYVGLMEEFIDEINNDPIVPEEERTSLQSRGSSPLLKFTLSPKTAVKKNFGKLKDGKLNSSPEYNSTKESSPEMIKQFVKSKWLPKKLTTKDIAENYNSILK